MKFEDVNDVKNPSLIDPAKEAQSLENMDSTNESDEKVKNPFVELKNLITEKNIKVKTILTEKQIIRLHRIQTVISDLNVTLSDFPENIKNATQRKKSMIAVKKLLEEYNNNFMTLVINKDGLSRKQFIEALHKGSEKAEEAKNERVQQVLGLK